MHISVCIKKVDLSNSILLHVRTRIVCITNFRSISKREERNKIRMKIDLHPKICPLCGGRVEFVPVTRIYGQNLKFGEKSGFCYHCKKCDAIVGTHKNNPTEALGLLANKTIRELRIRNHNMFDKFWKNKAQRQECYLKLAKEMELTEEECHFAWFDEKELERSYQIMLRWWREKYDR